MCSFLIYCNTDIWIRQTALKSLDKTDILRRIEVYKGIKEKEERLWQK